MTGFLFEDEPDAAPPSGKDAVPDQDEVQTRAEWRRLVDSALPEAAKTRRDWPVALNHCFARILLDNAVGQMWRDAIPAPAWRNTPLPVLQTAIDLGAAILRDEADIWALNDQSLIMRGKEPRGRHAYSLEPTRRRSARSGKISRHGRVSQARRFKV